MKKIVIGKGKKKILLIHGWMNSSKRYLKFANDLKNEAEITLVDLPGFGKEEVSEELLKKESLLDFYRDEVIALLKKEKFNIIMGHSLGGNLILRSLEKENYKFNGTVILLNPAYNGIEFLRIVSALSPINRLLFRFQSILPRKLVKFLIKVVALIGINKWKLIDDIVIEDALASNPYIAEKVMKELVFDKWRISKKNKFKNIIVVKSDNDRLIKTEKTKRLMKDIGKGRLIHLKGTGHTTILEDYDKLINIVRKEIHSNK